MLGVRLDPETERALEALSRRTHRSKSEIVREILSRHVRDQDEAYRTEARRQSRHAAAIADPEEESFWEALHDDRDWTE